MDRPINPMAFKNFSVSDTIPPKVLGLYYKSISENSVSGSNSSFNYLKISKVSENLFIADTLKTSGLIGFGINSYDRMNNTWNKMGLSNIKTNINGDEVFDMDFNSFSYDEWRHINTFIDYASYKNDKIKIQKLYIEDYNPLSMYNRSLGDGIIEIEKESEVYLYSIQLFDFNKNYTEILVPIQWKKQNGLTDKKSKINNIYSINRDSLYNILLPNSSVTIQKKSLYTNKQLQIFEKNNSLFVDKDSIPLLKGITIKLSLNRYNDSLIDKTYIARIGDNNKSTFISSNRKNDHLIAKINNLGNYMVKIDSIPPKISLINISKNQWISNRKKLMIKINDNESGINNYRGTINNKWILLEYNPMKNILTYDFKDNVNKTESENILKVEIEDNVGNTKTLTSTFYRKITE